MPPKTGNPVSAPRSSVQAGRANPCSVMHRPSSPTRLAVATSSSGPMKLSEEPKRVWVCMSIANMTFLTQAGLAKPWWALFEEAANALLNVRAARFHCHGFGLLFHLLLERALKAVVEQAFCFGQCGGRPSRQLVRQLCNSRDQIVVGDGLRNEADSGRLLRVHHLVEIGQTQCAPKSHKARQEITGGCVGGQSDPRVCHSKLRAEPGYYQVAGKGDPHSAPRCRTANRRNRRLFHAYQLGDGAVHVSGDPPDQRGQLIEMLGEHIDVAADAEGLSFAGYGADSHRRILSGVNHAIQKLQSQPFIECIGSFRSVDDDPANPVLALKAQRPVAHS